MPKFNLEENYDFFEDAKGDLNIGFFSSFFSFNILVSSYFPFVLFQLNCTWKFIDSGFLNGKLDYVSKFKISGFSEVKNTAKKPLIQHFTSLEFWYLSFGSVLM